MRGSKLILVEKKLKNYAEIIAPKLIWELLIIAFVFSPRFESSLSLTFFITTTY